MNKKWDGSEASFRNLFDEFYPALCMFAYGYVKDEAEAADIVSECFLTFWNSRAKFDNYLKIKSFLYIIVRNCSLNYIRAHRYKTEDVSDLESSVFFTNNLIEKEAFRIFYRAVNSLPERSREVILLSLDGLKNNEIAEELSIAESSVHTLKKIAYKKLKLLLKDYYYLVFIFLSELE